MRDTPSIVSGLAFTLLLHIFVAGLAVSKNDDSGCGGGDASGSTDFAEAETIEASLAFKEVKPKSKQPQKKKKQKFRPKADDGASRKEKLDPKREKPKKDTLPVDEDDIKSVLEKNRKQDEDLSDTGSDETPVEGSPTGSEWGTEKEARGDPYVGELKGHIKKLVKVPTLEAGSGVAIACVRLDKDGIILDRELKKRSKNTNLDRAVEVALKDAPDMDKPVPDTMINLLTIRGVCFKFAI
ncbi:MAG: TonB C-terminal domain-containing protein [Myxococcales bacterium]|nr:TonB C-terminal domain-containing protein [Myxococcales bacterium]